MFSTYPGMAEYHYNIKLWLKAIMQLDRLGTTVIPVSFSTPRRAFATGSSSSTNPNPLGLPLYSPPTEGNNFLPVIVFNLTGMTLKTEKIPPYEHILTLPIKDNNGTIVSYKQVKPLLVYEISYTAYLYAALMQDADILVFKFATEFKPQCHIWIGDKNYINVGEKGRWAQLVLDGITDGTEYEPGDIAERVVRKDLSFRVTEAYVPTLEPDYSNDVAQQMITDLYLP
jgi:hypothetical protein